MNLSYSCLHVQILDFSIQLVVVNVHVDQLLWKDENIKKIILFIDGNEMQNVKEKVVKKQISDVTCKIT